MSQTVRTDRNGFRQPMFTRIDSSELLKRAVQPRGEGNALVQTLICRRDPNCRMLPLRAPSVCSGSISSAGPSPSAPELSDQKLDAVAAALERVVSLQKDYRQRIAEAETDAEKERIVTEAHGEFTKAVTDQGLSFEEYASILAIARDDPEIRGKLLRRIRPSDK